MTLDNVIVNCYMHVRSQGTENAYNEYLYGIDIPYMIAN